ncbi:hypothetical protein FB451DRAFT_1178080 [Mycena latifolia]|nr:hypothetical protein FB451DRAFT_1178080 [Mycena latifolia]
MGCKSRDGTDPSSFFHTPADENSRDIREESRFKYHLTAGSRVRESLPQTESHGKMMGPDQKMAGPRSAPTPTSTSGMEPGVARSAFFVIQLALNGMSSHGESADKAVDSHRAHSPKLIAQCYLSPRGRLPPGSRSTGRRGDIAWVGAGGDARECGPEGAVGARSPVRSGVKRNSVSVLS